MMPVSCPSSHWSHQRTASCRKPIAGPGTPLCGKDVRPRPDQPLPRALQAFEQARHGVGIAVGPAADRVDRALDRAVVLAHRAVAPEVVAPLVLQPERREGHQVVDPLLPHLAPALADDLGIGRIGAVAEQDRAPLQVLVEQAAAHVVGVVGVAVVGRAERDDRLRAPAAASAATWSALKPPQEMPIMPTAPVHQGCAAIQAMISTASSCSCWVYSSSRMPSESPEPRRSTRTAA